MSEKEKRRKKMTYYQLRKEVLDLKSELRKLNLDGDHSELANEINEMYIEADRKYKQSFENTGYLSSIEGLDVLGIVFTLITLFYLLTIDQTEADPDPGVSLLLIIPTCIYLIYKFSKNFKSEDTLSAEELQEWEMLRASVNILSFVDETEVRTDYEEPFEVDDQKQTVFKIEDDKTTKASEDEDELYLIDTEINDIAASSSS